VYSQSALQEMCEELKKTGDILACYALSKTGMLLGASYGEWLPLDANLKTDFAQLSSVVWGSLDRVASIGGPLKECVFTFENFKLVGFPIEGTDFALLMTVETKRDSEDVKGRAQAFVSNWLKTNQKVDSEGSTNPR
jgi:hypothetical protein